MTQPQDQSDSGPAPASESAPDFQPHPGRTALTISSWHPSLMVLFSTILFAYAIFLPLLSGDLGWHIRVGQYTLETLSVPRTNFLCWTSEWHPWLTHEWLSGSIYALLDRAGGLPLLLYTRGVLYLGTLLLLYRLGRKFAADPLLLCGLILLEAATLALHVSLRPWGFSNLLLVGMLLLIVRARSVSDSTGIRLAAVLILGVWINLHGGYIVGAALFASFLIEQLIVKQRLQHRSNILLESGQAITWMALLTVVLLQNPHGIEALLLPFRYALGEQSSGLALTAEIKEWAPLQLNSLFGGIWIFWFLLTLLSLYTSSLRSMTSETVLGLTFLFLCLHAQRHLPIAAILLFPTIARQLLSPAAGWLQKQPSRCWARYWVRMSQLEAVPRPKALLFLILLTSGVYWNSSRSESFEELKLQVKAYPQRAVEYLATQPPLRLLNHYDHAGLLAWKAPEWPLFITPVNDAYQKQLFADWLTIVMQISGWETTFKAYDIQAILFPTDSAIISHFRALPEWRVKWEEAGHTLLVRTPMAPEWPQNASQRHYLE